eukprot:m.200415 g.200415  ORF g.200415 m.200415 type:complete len:91 (-) comp18403_c0_seq2:472-744(-)
MGRRTTRSAARAGTADTAPAEKAQGNQGEVLDEQLIDELCTKYTKKSARHNRREGGITDDSPKTSAPTQARQRRLCSQPGVFSNIHRART